MKTENNKTMPNPDQNNPSANPPDSTSITASNTAVPALRFPEFRGNKGWEEKKLGKIGKFTGGGTPSKANESYWQGKYPWISSSDISEDSIYQIDIRRYITQEAIENSATKKVPKDSILILSRVGIGKIAISYNEIYTSQDFTNLTPKEDNLLFLAYQLKSKAHKFSDFSQGMGIQGFTKDDISNFQVSLPSLQEQQKIAECLASIDAQITAEGDYLQTLQTHKQGLLQKLFPADGDPVPQLRFKGFEGEWEEEKLGDISQNLDSHRIPITTKDRVKGDIPYYGASGIIDYVKGYIFNDELLCVSEDGANLIDRVYPIAFSISGKTWVNNHAHVLKFENNCTQKVVQNYLNSVSIEKYLTGMAQPKLNKAKLSSISILLPCIVEQQKIANCLSSLDELITAQSDKIDALKQHKQGLMQQLFPRME